MMIKTLTELVTLLDQALPDAEALLSHFSHSNRAVLRVYHTIQTNHCRTEAEAIQKASIGERTKFRQVARELLRCLEQMVLYLEFEKQVFDPLNHSRIRGFQLTAIAKSLSPLACKNSAKKAAEELLRLGQNFARPEFVVEASKLLMDHVAVAADDFQAFETYVELFESGVRDRLLEEQAVMYFQKTKIPSIKRKSLQREHAEHAQAYLDELAPYVGQINSHQFHVSYYSLLSYRHTLEAQYQQASRAHDEALAYFSARPYNCQHAMNIFLYLEIVNCFYLGNYSRGNRYFQQALGLALPGSFNWFSTLELGFYLKMHQGDYLQAAEVYQQAVRHKRMAVLSDTHQETWQILGAYLYIVQQLTGALIPEHMAPKVKSARFRNEVKDFTQDKQGMNIAILAAEVLLELVEGKHDQLWDRIAALEKYRERYLKHSNDTHRSQLFIKILVVLSRHHYDHKKFQEKAGPLIEALRKAPLQLTNQSHELEIVPYEALVRLISQYLGWHKRMPQTRLVARPI